MNKLMHHLCEKKLHFNEFSDFNNARFSHGYLIFLYLFLV